ncbi:hypothetical protein [Lewinella sp. LCG006]|uniref:hypothetical protein n=1 Tax=Lewinella sp. LCG006 TaxID=3231911 RepID=UPI003460504A
MGQRLLTQLRATDQVLDQTITGMTAFNTELAIYQGLLQRTTADNETRYKLANIKSSPITSANNTPSGLSDLPLGKTGLPLGQQLNSS